MVDKFTKAWRKATAEEFVRRGGSSPLVFGPAPFDVTTGADDAVLLHEILTEPRDSEGWRRINERIYDLMVEGVEDNG